MSQQEKVSKNDALKAFTDEIKGLIESSKQFTKKGEMKKDEIREVVRSIVARCGTLKELYRSKGKRRAPKVPGAPRAKNNNKGLSQPFIAHANLKTFITTAPSFGLSRPFNYEYKVEQENGEDVGGWVDSEGKRHFFKWTDEKGQVLYDKDTCGRGAAEKVSKTNKSLSDVLHTIRTTGLIGSNQLHSLISIYSRLCGLKNSDGTYHVDAHMDKCLASSLKFLEENTDFNRQKFSYPSFMKIFSFFQKRNLSTLPDAKVQELAEKHGLSVENFKKDYGMSKSEIDNYLDSAGLVKEEFSKAIKAESEVLKLASLYWGHHQTPPRKVRPPPKTVAPVVGVVEKKPRGKAAASKDVPVAVVSTPDVAVPVVAPSVPVVVPPGAAATVKPEAPKPVKAEVAKAEVPKAVPKAVPVVVPAAPKPPMVKPVPAAKKAAAK